ncbi:cob(I)yrinic acid a,c-diamide adenosyltransferase [Pseudomethylobacillus aquaticus]|uniref:Cobalamin adenosyltransferase n=1 Tax=Pseudomethylobacillus aquaticus TaxID=2676064 RepID=A0A3N0UVI7_9PROT|nr:cob(I)yrinic acid a,c-diamide adenosyltransferase [Pseudomethylobacillus aquaticus]ROH84495.1 cob(I)yrinic acid a,c-diamide adenosyltransferase [Pseudomethylobacillus aquaticus]
MGNRLSKIYTRTGDDGTTGLGDGSRIDKDSLRVEAMGDVDELNAIIGMLLTETLREDVVAALTRVQHDLFDLGGEICIPGHAMVKAERVTQLEQLLDALNEPLEPLKEFILPGGSRGAAVCHLARTVCRRAERQLIRLSRESEVTAVSLQYLNRLSDLLFVLARALNRDAGQGDVLWKNQG